MKKILFLFLTVIIVLGAGCVTPTDDSVKESGGKYRKVTISGDLLTDFDESKASGPVVVCQPSGAYKIELYFDAKGGSWAGESSNFWLTDYDCLVFNGAQDSGCTESLTSAATVKQKFHVKGGLIKGGLSFSDFGVEGFDSEVYFMLDDIKPELGPVDIFYSCNSGDVIKPDPGALTQIFYPFNNRENLQLSFPTAVGRVYEKEPVVAYSLGNMSYLYSVKVEQEWTDVVGQ